MSPNKSIPKLLVIALPLLQHFVWILVIMANKRIDTVFCFGLVLVVYGFAVAVEGNGWLDGDSTGSLVFFDYLLVL